MFATGQGRGIIEMIDNSTGQVWGVVVCFFDQMIIIFNTPNMDSS